MAGPAGKSATVTIVMTDIVGSTELLERMGDEAGVSIMTDMTRLLRECAESHDGHEVKNFGDSLMLVFGSTIDAIACAVSMQQAMHRYNQQQQAANRLQLRIGINVGEPIRIEADYFGMPVVVAARVCNSSDAGQIAVTELVRAVAGSRGGFTFRDLPARTMKGVKAPVPVWEIAWTPEAAPATAPVPTLSPRSAPAEEHQRPHETAIILFADIVESTALYERLGDAAFRERSRALDGAVREAVRAAGGTPVEGKVMGDGVLAVFASARQAIDAALRCREASTHHEQPLHLGLHAGDVMPEGDNVYGGAVNIASRICDASAPGEILVSETVRGLARTSAGVTFEDRGERALKGIDEPQRLYAVRAGEH